MADSNKTRNMDLLLRKKDVLKVLGISHTTFYKRIKSGDIPQGIPLGPRIRCWSSSEIQTYIAKCISQRDIQKI